MPNSTNAHYQEGFPELTTLIQQITAQASMLKKHKQTFIYQQK